jgi:hypothetical protein
LRIGLLSDTHGFLDDAVFHHFAECEGVTVYMTHIGGYPGNYDRRAGKEVRRLR